MYLKSLEVQGFKSFANKLVFEFHNGITAIVGPNGSGKSNVADAVRWVLGEQSARQLRGARMEDVIFAGTQMRKPLGYAYVAITISNEDHKLNVPYEEVTIARRVYRSGESEYLLNGAGCRLKDIQELLFDTGIGKEGYSIIGQGQIDRILSGRPEERRELFDEAAGIVKYKKRKAAAEKNLEEEQQNMVRIEDILSELEKQVGPLEQQSEKARQYLNYRDELRRLDVNMFLAEYDSMQENLRELAGKKSIAEDDLKQAQMEFDKTKEQYVRAEQILEEQGRKLETTRERLNDSRMRLNQYEGDRKLLEEQINTAAQSDVHYQESLDNLQMQIEQVRLQKAEYEKERESAGQQLAHLSEEQRQREAALSETEERIAALEESRNACNEEIRRCAAEASEFKSSQQKYETLLEQNSLRRAGLTQRILENRADASRQEEELAEQEQEFSEITDKIEGMDAAEAEIRQMISSIRKKAQEQEKEHRDIQQKFHMQNSRLHSLRNMTERYEGFGQSIRRVMEQKQKYPGILGVVADIIRVKKDYEIAIETALGGSIQNIVTDNEQTAKAMIQYLKQNRFGRATFLPLTNISGRAASQAQNILSEPGVIGLGSSLVETDAGYEKLAEYLLGRFIVVDHIDHAIALARKYHHTVRIVTLEGDLINRGGSMSGGAYRNSNNLLGRRREMESLENEVAALKKRLDELVQQMEDGTKESRKQQQALEQNREIRQKLVLKQNTARLNLERLKEEREKNRQELEAIQGDSRGIEQEKERLSRELESLSQSVSSQESRSREAEEKISRTEEEISQAQQKRQEFQESCNALRMEIATQEQKKEFIQENLNRTLQEQEQREQELVQLQESSSVARQRVDEKQQQLQTVRQQIADAGLLIEELEKQVSLEAEEKERLTVQNKDFFEKREQLSEQMSRLDKECFRLENQSEKLQERMDSRTNYMWEEYELTYHSAEELKTQTTLSVSEMKKKAAEYKADIKALGDVNVNAIEQYKEVMERYTLLRGQHDDLIQAAEVLQGIIAELDTEMRRQFEEQFAQIKIRFDKVFKELFGGGRGTLELMEEEDILTAGVKIIAQPPGKKLQNMMQLSGGEKALTAIALLFAIQSLKPSPFCLLDEIEAALDDSNVGRYAAYLHKLTKDTQFIVITHRRGTMNAADILYGITMQEKGVSTLVSVNLLDEKDIT